VILSQDIKVFDRSGKLKVLGQVRGYRETSTEWATELLPDILMDEHRPPYLVLVTRDQTYFWRDPVNHPVPAYSIATNELLKEYLQPLQRSAADVGNTGLGMLLFDWIADARRNPSRIPERLAAIGFSDAIHNGRLEFQTAA